MLRKVINNFTLPIISAILLTLSYPTFNFEWIAWFSFIPLFFAISNKRKPEVFRIGLLCGLVFFGLTIYWLNYVSIPGYIVLVSILALFFALFSLFIQPLISKPGVLSVLLIPLIWILLEYVRTYALSGFGWALLGYSQYLNLPIIQIADKTGVFGVSFLIMIVNIALFSLLKVGIKKAAIGIVITLSVFSFFYSYGYTKLNTQTAGNELTVSLIQGSVPQDQKWDVRYKEEILSRYESLTRDAALENPDLIIWPETALPGYLEEEDILTRITNLTKEINTPLLVGTPTIGSYERNIYYNSAVLIFADGRITDKYDKMHLVPFGEYVPFEKSIAFIRKFINKPIGDFSAGTRYTIFELPDNSTFGVLICFEDLFPNRVKTFKKKGADFMVNITNDAWFMETSAPYQHAQASVFRAVENRIPVLRAANTGLSCFIDSRGRITEKVSVDGKDIFVPGFKTSKIYISE